MNLIRKTQRAKWEQKALQRGVCVSADAITHCLKTHSNQLSTWEVTDQGLDKAVLAIISAFETLESIDIIIMSSDDLSKNGIKFKQTNGETPYKNYNNHHYDLVDLDYDLLGQVSNVIVEAIIGGDIKRYVKSELREIMKNGLANGDIQLEDLSSSLQKEVSKS